MRKSLSPKKALMPCTKRLAAACRMRDPKDGSSCAQHTEALPEGADSVLICDVSALQAAREAYDVAIDKRDQWFDLTAAMHRIVRAWMDAMGIDSDRSSTFRDLLQKAIKRCRAGEVETDSSYRHNPIRFPVCRQQGAVPKITQLRWELKEATQQIAEACEQCSCDREDCAGNFADHLQALLANRRKAKAEPTAICFDAVKGGFRALVQECDAHFHLSAAVRLVAFAWEDVATHELDKLILASQEIKAALDHLRIANYGRSIKVECAKLREAR